MLEFLGIKSPSRNIEIEIPLMENLPNNVKKIYIF